MMEQPLVSVIMPVFNASKFLDDAIRSVLDQTYRYLELLVVNDGSTDHSEQVIRKYADNDDRIRYFYQQNSGVSSARNLALQKMKGDFFCFLDSDDWLPLNSIELRLKRFFSSEEIFFVDGSVDVYAEDKRTIERTWRPEFQGNPLSQLIRLSSKCFFGPTWMIKVADNVSYQFDDELTHAEDLLFYISIANGGEYSFVSDTTYCYRNRSGSAMKNISALGEGYYKLGAKLKNKNYFSFKTRIFFTYKVKRIMALSFLRSGDFWNAIKYLVRWQ